MPDGGRQTLGPAAPGSTSTVSAPTTSPSAPPSVAVTSASATPSATVVCGVDNTAPAVQAAIASLPAIDLYGETEAWGGAYDGNYDPCATLSVVDIIIARGTGSSPAQSLLFHEGRYVGTATSDYTAFVSLDTAPAPDGSVVLAYYRGASCTACDDGTTTRVTYTWDGTKVVPSGPVPALG